MDAEVQDREAYKPIVTSTSSGKPVTFKKRGFKKDPMKSEPPQD